MKPPFIDQRHEHGFNDIILVVRVGYFIAACFFYGFIQRSFAHFCTEGAGVGFFSLIENNSGDVGVYDSIRHFQSAAKIRDPIQMKAWVSQVNGDGFYGKGAGIEPFQPVQGIQKRQAVFPAGDSHGDLIACLDHLIFIHGFSCIAEKLLQFHNVFSFLSFGYYT